MSALDSSLPTRVAGPPEPREPWPSVRRLLAGVAVVAATCAGGSAAHAGFELSPLVSRGVGGLDFDAGALDALVGDLGAAARPGLGGPATTVGALGFTFGYQLAYTPVSERAAWDLASRGAAPDALVASEFFVRKGLPLSLELGMTLAWFHHLDLQVASFELKWAFVEGLDGLPDLGARLHVSGLFGLRDITIVAAGADVTIGKRFGLGGALRIAPYAGYAFGFAHGVPRPIGVVLAGDVEATTAILPAPNVLSHRALLGLELALSYGTLGVEASLGAVTTVTVRVGASL